MNLNFGKVLFAKTVFGALGRAIKGGYKIDSQIVRLVQELPNDYTVIMSVKGTNAKLSFTAFEDNLIVHKLKKAPKSGDLEIVFKSIDCVLPLLCGFKGIGQAYSEHDFIMRGDICKGMVVVDLISLIEAYLFPTFMLKRIMLSVPKTEKSKARMYGYFISGK